MPVARLVVEAPGYCPPGPKCLFHAAIYRHSRLPGAAYIGILQVNLKRTIAMAALPNGIHGEHKSMKRLAFVTVGAACLVLSACHRDNQDAVQNAELNQPDAEQLNELANQAAVDANAQAPATNKLQDENAAAVDNTVNPREADEQNVSGM